MDAALAEVYLSHMLQIGDSSEALETLSRLERKHSTHSNRSLLLDSTPGKGTGSGLDFTNGFGSKLKVGALLYAKVVSVLVRANRTQEAEDLKKVLEAKNLTRTYILNCITDRPILILFSLTHSLTHSLTQSLIQSLTQSIIHSITQSLTHSPTK